MKYHFIQTGCSNKKIQNKTGNEDMEKLQSLVEMGNGAATMENRLTVPHQVQCRLTKSFCKPKRNENIYLRYYLQ
jgi:hypothetical protein